MNGKFLGVSIRIENKLDQNIPYLHCYNHGLHLAELSRE